MKTSVLIVGAGPTGLMAALELTRLGISVRLIDKLPERAKTSRALAIQARTLELFEQRGFVDEFLKLGQRCFRATFHANREEIAHVELDRIPSRYNYILLLSQAETERILTERLEAQGIQVERAVEMVTFSQTDQTVQATLKKPSGEIELVEATYMISAEGAHSVARRTLNMNFSGKTIEQRYAVADLHIDGDVSEDGISLYLADKAQYGAFLGIFPMGQKRFRFIATDPRPTSSEAGAPTLEELQTMFDTITGQRGRLYDLNWSSPFKINSRHIDRLRMGRIFFGGDAAHIHSPAGGQGMNTGLQDMVNLCWKIAFVERGLAKPVLLRTYDEERLPVISAIVERTEFATQAMNSRHPLVQRALRAVLPIAMGQSFVQNFATKMLGEVAANYRVSSFSRNRNPLAPLQSGDRLADETLPDGSRLYEQLDANKLTLFARGTVPPDLAQKTALLNIRELKAPGFSGFDYVLVRPDGYIGYLGENASWDTFRRWLESWFC